MATLREIVTTLQNLLADGRPTDDVRVSDRQWAFIIDSKRAQLIRQQKEKGQYVAEENVQELGVLPLARQSCGKWKSDKPLPRTIELYHDTLLYVSTPDGKTWQQTTAQAAEFSGFARYTSKLPKWYVLGGDLWGIHPTHTLGTLKARVRGVFEHPRQALEYAGTLPDYDELDFPYPMSTTSLDALYKLVTDNELRLLKSSPADTTNDARDAPDT